MTATIAYRSELAEIWHGDARDVLQTIATESIDLVVTDPPYGVEWQSKRRVESFDQLLNDGSDDADREGIRSILAECVRLVGQNRHLYVFGPPAILDGLKVSAATALIWDKATMSGGDLGSSWGPAHEEISFVVSKFRHGGEAGRSFLPVRLRKGSVLRFARPTGRKVRHPSEKPVPLLRELIESSSRQGETILDPFAGVGSTGVAAILSGRRTILVELDPKFVPIAVDRIRSAEEVARTAATI